MNKELMPKELMPDEYQVGDMIAEPEALEAALSAPKSPPSRRKVQQLLRDVYAHARSPLESVYPSQFGYPSQSRRQASKEYLLRLLPADRSQGEMQWIHELVKSIQEDVAQAASAHDSGWCAKSDLYD